MVRPTGTICPPRPRESFYRLFLSSLFNTRKIFLLFNWNWLPSHMNISHCECWVTMTDTKSLAALVIKITTTAKRYPKRSPKTICEMDLSNTEKRSWYYIILSVQDSVTIWMCVVGIMPGCKRQTPDARSMSNELLGMRIHVSFDVFMGDFCSQHTTSLTLKATISRAYLPAYISRIRDIKEIKRCC